MNINLKDLTPDQIKDLREQLAQIEKVPHYTDIKSWEDAYDIVKPRWFVRSDGNVPKMLQDIMALAHANVPSELHAKSLRATAKLMVISEALNPKGWKADWKDFNQNKWTMHYSYQNGNFKFECYNYTKTASIYFATKEIAEYAMKQFEELFLDMLMIERDGK